MLKKVLFAAALSLVVAGGAMIAAPAPTEAGHAFQCWKKAKAKYGHGWKKRHAYREACHAKHKAKKHSHKGKKGPFKRLFKKAA